MTFGGKQMIFWIVALLVIAAVVYYFFTPAGWMGPYLEGFSSKYPTGVIYEQAINAIQNLYFLQNNKRIESAEFQKIMTDISNICPMPTNNLTDEMSKDCFNIVAKKLNLNTGQINTPENINKISANQIISVLNRQLGLSYSTLTASDIDRVIKMEADLSNACVVSPTGTITKECYNRLITKFASNTSTPITSTMSETSDAVKERRVELFLAMAETAGYDDIDEEDVRNSYDDMTKTCGKKSVSNDRACYEDIAKDLKIKLFASSSSSPAYDELKGSGNTPLKITGTSTSNAASVGTTTAPEANKSYDAKCTVQFGNDAVVSPQTKAATEKPVEKTCGTTGDVAKTTKTPAVEQGCEFAQKFPKVNVINLRDYVHKDEVPCWSCKL